MSPADEAARPLEDLERTIKRKAQSVKKTNAILKRTQQKERRKMKVVRKKLQTNSVFQSLKAKHEKDMQKIEKKRYKSPLGKIEKQFKYAGKKKRTLPPSIKLKGKRMATYNKIMKLDDSDWSYSDSIPNAYKNQPQSKKTGGRLWKQTYQEDCFTATQAHLGVIHEKFATPNFSPI
jgi:hypothetical protein